MTDDTQAMSVRLPVPLYEQLRRAAFEARTPMNQIIVTAVERALSEETA